MATVMRMIELRRWDLAGDESFVRALLDRHPWKEEKFGAGVAWVEIRSDSSGRSRRFGIVRPDSSSADVSWRSGVAPMAYVLDGPRPRDARPSPPSPGEPAIKLLGPDWNRRILVPKEE